MVNADWSFTTRKGNDGLDHRVPNWDGKTPCKVCPKIPKDAPKVPESAQELTDKHWATYTHYKECRAVSDWPRTKEGGVDPIVRRNAVVIRNVEEDYDRYASMIPLQMFMAKLNLVSPPTVRNG